MDSMEDHGEGSNGHPPTLLQLINYEEEFSAEMRSFLSRSGFDGSQMGSDYKVVAIIGPQSSGKSTLLNLLFETAFQTMDESQGRYQVTQGVWLGCDLASRTLVMDLEGTDSRERGEAAVSFERKSSLFALALSEVLIINVWTQDVGRLNASNFGLLKTILELNAQLFQSASSQSTRSPGKHHPNSSDSVAFKTKLLFVLRDHVATPLEKLAEILLTDLHKIWEAIDKPDALRGTKLDAAFDVEFRALPHKILAQEDFLVKAKQLNHEFHSEIMYRPEYKRDLDIDALPLFAENVWAVIRSSKDLDIPTQKQMVATIRCTQIAKEAQAEAESQLTTFMQSAATSDGMLRGLQHAFDDIYLAAHAKYDQEAHRYAQGIYTEKKRDMDFVLLESLRVIFDERCQLAAEHVANQFEARANAVRKLPAAWKHADTLRAERTEAVESFLAGTGAPPEHAKLPLSPASKALASRLDAVLVRTLQTILEASDRDVDSLWDKEFSTRMANLADHAKPASFWQQTTTTFESALAACRLFQAEIVGQHGLSLPSDEQARIMAELTAQCIDDARADLLQLIGSESVVLKRALKRFEESFRFDERGVPRSWSERDKVDELYLGALAQGNALIETFANGRVGQHFKMVILSEQQVLECKDNLQRSAAPACTDAKRVQEAALTKMKVPVWLIGLLIVLGWNEFMMLFRNPWLLVFLLMLSPLVYLYITLDLNSIIVPMATAMIGPYYEQAKRVARDLLDDGLPRQANSEASGFTKSDATGSLGTASTSSAVAASVSSDSNRREVSRADALDTVASFRTKAE